jgi:aminoglycoside phosphotransferase (APT) family kinase protein
MGADEITRADLERIARELWGNDARLQEAREIVPVADHGVWRVAGCNANRSYMVRVAGHEGAYVMRFDRGRYGQDRYDHEARMYALVAERTSIPVPRVHRVDRSRSVVPTSYMVLDGMQGDEARYLAHPRCLQTSATDKREVLRLLGDAYAQMHGITRAAPTPDALVEHLIFRLEQVQHVTEDGQLDLNLETIHRAKEAVRRDPSLRVTEESLCIGDSELHLVREGDAWRLAFLCDMAWVDFGDAYLDLANLVTLPEAVWELDAPLDVAVEDLAGRPWVEGYAARRPLDLAKLALRALYAQVNVICSVAGDVYRPEKQAFVVGRTPLYRALMEAVVARGLSR